jgi:hypothetical protein
LTSIPGQSPNPNRARSRGEGRGYGNADLDPCDVERALEIRSESFGVLGADTAAYEAAKRKAIEVFTTIGG